jgi:hypothetical protein
MLPFLKTKKFALIPLETIQNPLSRPQRVGQIIRHINEKLSCPHRLGLIKRSEYSYGVLGLEYDSIVNLEISRNYRFIRAKVNPILLKEGCVKAYISANVSSDHSMSLFAHRFIKLTETIYTLSNNHDENFSKLSSRFRENNIKVSNKQSSLRQMTSLSSTSNDVDPIGFSCAIEDDISGLVYDVFLWDRSWETIFRSRDKNQVEDFVIKYFKEKKRSNDFHWKEV